ncbi:hypothetical protein HYH03_014594 [Edaphochlamys debaryana]|uniref:Uncharacterized protein n=1 Tax=Edaphochlamys debaryana TaxID=47281 RepID=A0A835XNM1_9CHLO|nr:hypothetical protein HYH03_014594 [Edaphochlamys debaryana]|eukprot:KAG2486795.1 hypothetical protein HYH03_014594 [Edaphochlamys debaryana]
MGSRAILQCLLVALAATGALAAGSASCICTFQYDPVCVKGQTFGNLCEAQCKYGLGVTYTSGACTTDLNPIKNCASRIAIKCMDTCSQPWPAYCQPLPEGAQCFVNSCADLKIKGLSYPACAPLWVDPATGGIIPCYRDPKPSPNANFLPPCPDKRTAACFVDPCQFSYCPAYPEAVCYSSYCAVERSYQGVSWGTCSALFVGDNGKAIKQSDCFSLEVKSINDCSPAAPYASCAVPSGDAPLPKCATATCPAHPEAACIEKGCVSTYRGVELPTCAPIFYDPVSGDLVDCTPKTRRHLRAAA